MTLLTWPPPATTYPSRLLLQRLARGERRKARVLLIEDDMAIALMYQLQLTTDGYDVELATDGLSGLRRVQDAPPDLVLLDIRLPRTPSLPEARYLSLGKSRTLHRHLHSYGRQASTYLVEVVR